MLYCPTQQQVIQHAEMCERRDSIIEVLRTHGPLPPRFIAMHTGIELQYITKTAERFRRYFEIEYHAKGAVKIYLHRHLQ